MTLLLRVATLLTAAWAAASAALFAALAVLAPASLTGPDAAGFLLGGFIVALALVPLGLLALTVAERGGMRVTPGSRMVGTVLVCVLPLFGAVILLQGEGGVLGPAEGVAFAFAGVVVGLVVGAAYPWVRGPFERGPRAKPREDVDSHGRPIPH